MRAPSLFQRASAEAFGTFALVTGGCGAIVVNHATGALGHGGVAASFGLVIMVMIASLGHLSGAHFNPAVTLAFAVTRHFSWRDVPSYLAGQLLGAVCGALALRACFGLDAELGATAPVESPLRALGIEILLTAVLMFVIVSVATDTRAVGELAAVAVGGTVALDALWGADNGGFDESGALPGARARRRFLAFALDLLGGSDRRSPARGNPLSGVAGH